MCLDSGPSGELDQIALFVSLKFIGNFVTLATMDALHRWRQHIAITVTVGIALAQLVLLAFLLGS